MKLIVWLVGLVISFPAFAQNDFVVTGKVVDKTSGTPLTAASVFAENTTFGVATSTDGIFNLKLPKGGYNIVVTSTGYENESIRISGTDNNALSFELRPKEKIIEEVSIVASNIVKDGWEKYGQIFTEQFAGTTAFSKQTSFSNADVLKFYFSKKKNRVKVLAAEPLIVVNKALGYTIKFAIDSFTYDYTNKISQFEGYPLFEELDGTAEQKEQWQQNRLKAYQGSQLQFMRSLFNQTLDSAGFEVQFIVKNNNTEMPIPVKNIYGALNYAKDDSTNTVEFKPNQPDMAIIYKKEKPEENYASAEPGSKKSFQLSTMSIAPGESIIVEQNGYYFDQKDVTTNDYWGYKKIADMLPYDYVPGSE
jgi:hypothetical protein